MKREFTATVFIIHEGRVLLIYHRKFQKWNPPGGHLMPDETPCDAARREVLEETGIEVELISEDNVKFSYPSASHLTRPHHLFIADVPPHGGQPAHQHIDLSYVGKPKPGMCVRETAELRWFTRVEVLALTPGQDIFPDARKVILALLPDTLA